MPKDSLEDRREPSLAWADQPSHANCMQHVLRYWERQAEGSEYKKLFGGQCSAQDPTEGTYSAPTNSLVVGEGLAVPSLRTPPPSGLASPTPTPKLVLTPLYYAAYLNTNFRACIVRSVLFSTPLTCSDINSISYVRKATVHCSSQNSKNCRRTEKTGVNLWSSVLNHSHRHKR